ncbi:MAG: double-cubane-cluster-containing anaerobic reductase [Actinobacteria bacterium]|nr:double-cubane-cluster-containing anaerobic reductase [Actinomycetota bacterium]
MGNYEQMWESLGINLEAHEKLLSALPPLYQEVYLSQSDRPKGMEYFDFVVSEIHGLRVKELQEHKKNGGKVVGTFCVYVPEEVVVAANAICVGLCGGLDIALDEVEKVLPRNLCALIKSFMGFKLSKVCPYFESCDLIVGETTCDGKKKAFEVLNEYAPVYVMETPQMKRDIDYEFFKNEIYRFIEKIEEITGNEITEESLRNGIRTIDAKRKALKRISEARKNVPSPISGKDALLVYQIAFYDDPERFTLKVNELADELDKRAKIAASTKDDTQEIRIMITGTPMAIPNWKLPHIVESSGARIVYDELCTGERYFQDIIGDVDDKNFDEMVDAITKRLLEIDCACFTPNEKRIQKVVQKVKEYKVDGVIHYSLQFCDPYTIEAFKLENVLKEEGIPVIKIETDYSQEDIGQLKTRIEAFLEMVSERKQ